MTDEALFGHFKDCNKTERNLNLLTRYVIDSYINKKESNLKNIQSMEQENLHIDEILESFKNMGFDLRKVGYYGSK